MRLRQWKKLLYEIFTGFIFQYICFCDISQVYHEYTLIVRWFKPNLKYKGSNCCVWYRNFMVFVFIQSDLHFIFVFFSIIIYLASDINIVLIYIILFYNTAFMTEENDKKNIYNNTNETLLNWYRKTKQMNNKNYSNKRP